MPCTTHSSRFIFAHGLALAAGLALAPVALADERPCAKRDQVIERLAEKYGETLQSIGMQSNAGVLEVYASEETGSWTILVTDPAGTACMIAAGQMWEGDASPLVKPGKDV